MLYPGHGVGNVGDDVDMEALRRKYSRPREQLLAEARQNQSSAANTPQGAALAAARGS